MTTDQAIERPPEAAATGVAITAVGLCKTVKGGRQVLNDVTNPAQATLALPMLCFPAVLFSGAIIPVHVMAGMGAAISSLMPDRWAFEALGHELGIRHLLLHGGSPVGAPLVRSYGSAGTASTGAYLLYLGAFAVVFFGGAWATLSWRCRRSTR